MEEGSRQWIELLAGRLVPSSQCQARIPISKREHFSGWKPLLTFVEPDMLRGPSGLEPVPGGAWICQCFSYL